MGCGKRRKATCYRASVMGRRRAYVRERTDGRGAAELGADRGGIALVEDGERPQFLARLAELEDSATPLDDLSGFNYSRGRFVHVTLYRVAPLHPVSMPSVR